MLTGILLAAPVAAQPMPKPLQIADAVGMRFFAPLQAVVAFAPDGRFLAYTMCDPRRVRAREDGAVRMDVTRATAGCAIRVRAYRENGRAEDEVVNVEHDGPAWAPSWSPDGRRLAFYAEDVDGIHVWLWDREQRVARRASPQVVDLKAGGETPLWSLDGRSLYTKLAVEQATPQAQPSVAAVDTQLPAWAQPGADGATVAVSRSGPSAAGKEADVPTFYAPVDIGAIDVASGQVRRLARGVRAAGYWLSPDGKYLAYGHQAELGLRNVRTSHWTLDLVDLSTGATRTLLTYDQFHGVSVRWSPDSRALAYYSGADGEDTAALFVSDNKSDAPRRFEGAAGFDTSLSSFPVWDAAGKAIYAIDEHMLWRGQADGGQLEAVGRWPRYELLGIVTDPTGNAAWSPDGGATLYVNARNKQTRRGELLRVDVATGAMQVLRNEALSIGERSMVPQIPPDGQSFIYAGQSGGRPVDLWMSTTDFTRHRRLTNIHPEFHDHVFGKQRLIAFTSRDGKPLQASLLLPAGYVPGRRYPMVVWVYGNDTGSDFVHRFGLAPMGVFNMQMLATRGYVVLYPDTPLEMGKPVESLVNTVMPAIDAAVDAGIADGERLAVMGQSAGGYSSLALVTRTDRFKAAIVCAGFSELASFYGHGWYGWLETGNGSLGAAPWEAPQRYVDNSPIYALDRVTTPLLIEAGAADTAVGEFPKYLFTSLQRMGKDAVYLRYEGEGHVLSSHANLTDFWNRVVAFLDVHLSNGNLSVEGRKQ